MTLDIDTLRPKAKFMANLLRSISNENRLLTICYLLEQERTVGDITDFLDISQPAASQMLLKMKDDGIVISRQEAQKVLYSVQDKDIIEVFETLSKLCESMCNN